MLVIAPSNATHAALVDALQDGRLGSSDGSDQGFLNSHLGDWFASDAAYRLPLVYNAPVELAIREPAYFATLWSERCDVRGITSSSLCTHGRMLLRGCPRAISASNYTAVLAAAALAGGDDAAAFSGGLARYSRVRAPRKACQT